MRSPQRVLSVCLTVLLLGLSGPSAEAQKKAAHGPVQIRFTSALTDTDHGEAEPPAAAGVATRPAAEGPGELDALVSRALDRVGMGKPPPRELYDVKFRDRIDWLRFPLWARPSDPKAYVGCGHEG